MNLPNLLTVSRIFLTLIFAAFAQMVGMMGALWAIVIFTLASLTDLFDGYLARKYNLITAFGKIMDPIADKCLTLTAMFIFAYEGTISLAMVMLIAAREILVTASRILAITRGQVLAAEQAGKIKTVFQITTISVVLLYRFLVVCPLTVSAMPVWNISFVVLINVLMTATTALTLWSGVSYFRSIKS